MSFPNVVDTVYANELSCTPVDSVNFNIVNSNGGEILLNGVNPSGGGASLPITGNGNITVTGNIRANGDGVSTGQLEGVIIKATTGNIIASAGDIVATAGNITASADGPGQGQLKGVTAVVSSNITITGDGDLTLNGNGDISVLGTGNIGVGVGGVISTGDINTVSGDILSAGDYYFEGNDIYHREISGFPPLVVDTSYVNFKQLVQLNAANTFTGANKFNSNVTEFSDKVSVGTRDIGGLFTQTIALNKSGNIECQTIQNVTSIQTGTVNCGNGGTNSCAAKTFTTRTSGLAGWNMEQQVASVPVGQYDNILNFRAGQVGGFVTITDSVVGPGVPNIILDPKTKAIGGLIKTSTYEVGDGGLAYKLTQPVTGADSGNLLIKSNSSTSEAIFRDETDASLLSVKKTEVQLGSNIALLFGNYAFLPTKYTYSNSITIRDTPDTTGYTNMIFNALGNLNQPTLGGKNVWTNVNTGQTGITLYNSLLEGFYKCTIKQTADSSSGSFRGTFIIFDYVLKASIQDTPDLTPAISYGYNTFPPDQGSGNTTIATILIDHKQSLSPQSQPVFLSFSHPPVAGETMPITVSLTKLDF